MTEQRASRERWLAAAGIAPLAAITFGVATAIVVDHQAATTNSSGANSASAAAVSIAESPRINAAQKEVRDLQAHIRTLKKKRSATAALPTSNSQSSSGSSGFSGQTQAAPTVHGSTGASGAVR